MSVSYTIEDVYIENVYIGIHTTVDDMSIGNADIVGTTGHGIYASGDRLSIQNANIRPKSGNGLTIAGSRGFKIGSLTVTGGQVGVFVTGSRLPEITPTERLNEIVDRFLGELSKVESSDSSDFYNYLLELKEGKNRSIVAERYNRIVGFISNHATVLTFVYQFFPALFGK